MATQGMNYGIQLSPNDTDYVTIQNITELILPNTVRDVSETTAHGSSNSKSYLGGLIDEGELIFTTNHNLYNVGEGFGNWNAQLTDGSFSNVFLTELSTTTMDFLFAILLIPYLSL